MNVLLFRSSELRSDGTLVLDDRRADHLINILKVGPNQEIKAGLVNGLLGTAKVKKVFSVGEPQVELSWTPVCDPPESLDCKLVLALPRPKMMRRVIQTVASLGVKEIHLINSWRVDKSYWQSPMISEFALTEQLLLGLEQAIDTIVPKIYKHRLFKPFAEDVLPSLVDDRLAVVAHPYNSKQCPVNTKQRSLIAIGPEGGFIDFEMDLLLRAGLQSVSLGPRILKVETAVPAIISRLHPS